MRRRRRPRISAVRHGEPAEAETIFVIDDDMRFAVLRKDLAKMGLRPYGVEDGRADFRP